MARRSRTPEKAAPNRPPAAAARKNAEEEKKPGRVEQVKAVWSMTREQDPKVLPLVLGPALLVLAVLVVVGILIGQIIIFSIVAVLAAVITGTTIFGRRATATMYAQVEGRPGAAAAVLQGMRGDWRVTPAVGFTRNQDLLHRVIGRPGIVLVGEGSVPALRQLMTDQKRRIGRVAPETPIHELFVGEGEGQVSIRRLQNRMVKLPRALKKSEVHAVEARMKALGGPNMPIPKGPVPQRIPRGKAMRGQIRGR